MAAVNEDYVSKGEAAEVRFLYLFAKRSFDIITSLLASIILLVPMLVLCIWIIIEDCGNPFYVHERVGKDGSRPNQVKNALTIHERASAPQCRSESN